MSAQISPYALLRASKPKPPSAVTTQYDLFSLSQASVSSSDTLVPPDIPPASSSPMLSSQPAPMPSQRTHYISDIHARHTYASKRTPQSTAPL